MNPRRGWGGAKELEQVGFGEWWRDLGSERCSFLGDALKLTTKASHLVKGAGARGVHLHRGGLGKAVSLRVVGPAADQFPGPEDFQCLLTGNAKELSQRGRDNTGVKAGRGPAGNETGDVAGQVGGGHTGPPCLVRTGKERTEGSGGFRAGHRAGAFARWLVWSTPQQAGLDIDGGAVVQANFT